MIVDNPDEMYGWDISVLWDTFVLTFETITDNEEMDEDIKDAMTKVKYGIFLPVPIYYLTNDNVDLYYATRTAMIHGIGEYDIELLMDEITKRKSIMIKVIKEHNHMEPVYARVNDMQEIQ